MNPPISLRTIFGRSALALALVVLLPILLAACQPSSPSQSSANSAAQSKKTASDDRWANFDDGSDVMSLSVPYFCSNANELSFNVALDRGTLVAELPEGAIGLDGALQGWQVKSATRSDDVTVAVTAERPEGLHNNGASIASVSLANNAVVLPDAEEAKEASSNSSASESAVEKIPSADEINEQKGVEWPDDAEIVNKTTEMDDPETGEPITDTPEATEKLIEAINAGEIKTAEDVSKFVSSESITDNATEEAPAAVAASETANGQDPAPYEVKAMFVSPALSIDFEQSKIEKDKMTAKLVASDFKFNEDLSASSFELRDAEGCAVTAARRVSDVEAEVEISLPDGAYLVTLNASEVPEDAVVSVDVPAVEDAAGNTVPVEPAAEMAEGNDDDRGIGAEIAKAVGIGALKAAISYSWKQTCNNALDPSNSKGLYQATEADAARLARHVLAGEGSGLTTDCYVQEADGKKCHYNHTTGAWYYSHAASETSAKWTEGMGSVMAGKRTEYTASSPFRRWNHRSPAFTWESTYMGTIEAQKMISKLHNGQTLKQELEGVGLATKAYLVTYGEYDDSQNLFPPYVTNDWLADMIGVEHATADKPSLEKARDGKNKPQKKIFDGWLFPTIFGSAKHESLTT